MKETFDNERIFMEKVTPDKQMYFATRPKVAIMGDYPTLGEIQKKFGDTVLNIWLLREIENLLLFTGGEIENKGELLDIIATEYYYLKVTEMQMFFYRFKTGWFGAFRKITSMVVMCALREFARDRATLKAMYEDEDREEEYQRLNPPMSAEEYKLYKNSKDLQI